MKKLEIGGGKKNRRAEGYMQMDIKNLPGIDIVGDAKKLPFKDNELDEIFGQWVVEHFYLRDIDEVLKEWHRALKPGGLLHLITNNGAAHIKSYIENEISIEEFNWMTFGHPLDEESYNHRGIEDLHKIFWTEQLVHKKFDSIFSKVEVRTTWQHREETGEMKCPGIIIHAYK